MLPTKPSVGRRIAAAVVVASSAALVAASMASAPAGAGPADSVTGSAAGCPTLTIDNPAVGARISAGDYLVSGAAVDPNASSGTGVARVDFFFGFRESGGVNLGSAIPGVTNDTPTNQPAGPVNRPGGFTVRLKFPSSISRGDNLVAYAYSATSSAVTSVGIPILVGTEPTPTPTGTNNTPVPLKAATAESNCTPSAVAQAPVSQAPVSQPAVVQASPSPVQIVAPAGQQAVVTTQGPVLRIDNPHSGDLIPVGDTIINGVAFDPAATSGSGVSRIEVFANAREAGGIFLGGGAPGTASNPEGFGVKVTVNANQNGAFTLFVYARSSITGRESVVQIPVFLGTGPTPTPHT